MVWIIAGVAVVLALLPHLGIGAEKDFVGSSDWRFLGRVRGANRARGRGDRRPDRPTERAIAR